MEFLELMSRFGLALGIGLFGLERGWRSREEPSGARAAGIRTFAISGLLGGVIGAIGQALDGVAGGILIGMSFDIIIVVPWRPGGHERMIRSR